MNLICFITGHKWSKGEARKNCLRCKAVIRLMWNREKAILRWREWKYVVSRKLTSISKKEFLNIETVKQSDDCTHKNTYHILLDEYCLDCSSYIDDKQKE